MTTETMPCCWICGKPTTFRSIISPNQKGGPAYFVCEDHADLKCSKCHIEDGRFFVHKVGAERQCLCEACCQKLTAPKPEPVCLNPTLAALGVGLLIMLIGLGVGWLLFTHPKGAGLASPLLLPFCILFVHIMFRGFCAAGYDFLGWVQRMCGEPRGFKRYEDED